MGGGKLSLADQHKLLLVAVDLHEKGTPMSEVEDALRQAGMPADQAKATARQAMEKYEGDVVRRVSLPASARSGINFYFLLGVTPRATTDQIRRAYRRKAKVVHPDQHNKEFSRDEWERLMTMVADAHTVLTDDNHRKAYDIVWRQRSRQIAIDNRKKGEVRGDWETRYRWDIAELAGLEDQVMLLIDELKESMKLGSISSSLLQALSGAVEHYESRILDIRTESYALPKNFESFGEQVRREMQRKERAVPTLHKLHYEATHAGAFDAAVKAAEAILTEVQGHQSQFDIRAAKNQR
jgi:curved DNA-binding protein CbpA